MRHTPLTDDQEAAALAHLRTDHAAHVLIIARAFGPDPEASDARALAIDADGLDLEITAAGRPTTVTVPFAHRLTTAAQLTERFATLYRAARHTLGLPPTPDPV